MLNSSGAIIEHDHKFLLVCTRKGNWGFPKGSVEPGETLEQAAIRVVKEETGLDVSIDPQRKTAVTFTTSKGRKKKITLFYAVPKTTHVKIQEKEKKIDFNLANLEQAALFEEIQKKGGGGELESFLNKLNQNDKKLFYIEKFDRDFKGSIIRK